MKNNIYLVVSGEFDEKEICGYFTSKLNAEKFCELRNRSLDYKKYEIELCESLDETDLSDVEVYYSYTFLMNEKFRVIADEVEPEEHCGIRPVENDIYDEKIIVYTEKEDFDDALSNAYKLSFYAKKQKYIKEKMAEIELKKVIDGLNGMKERFEETH